MSSRDSISSQRFIEWLTTEPSEHMATELLWWCATGSGRGRDESAPSDFILGSLPIDGRRPALSLRLAQRISIILKQNPNLNPAHPMAEEAMTHLLLVSTRLASADELGGPIWHAYENLRQANATLPAQLGSALLPALMYNPVRNDEPVELWSRLLSGTPDPLFGGTPDQGIMGMFLLRSPESRPGSPNFDAIGKGLILLARHYDHQVQATRFQRFRCKLRQFVEMWQIREPMSLIMMAHRAGWHDTDAAWALKTLPVLFRDFGVIEGGECVVWHSSLRFIEDIIGATAAGEPLCGGWFRVIKYPPTHAVSLNKLLVEIEKARLPNSEISEHEYDNRVAESIAWAVATRTQVLDYPALRPGGKPSKTRAPTTVGPLSFFRRCVAMLAGLKIGGRGEHVQPPIVSDLTSDYSLVPTSHARGRKQSSMTSAVIEIMTSRAQVS